MGSHGSEPSGSRHRLLVLAAIIATGAALVALALATGGLHLPTRGQSVPTAEQAAQDRCQADVLTRVVRPTTATFSDVRTKTSSLETDGKDLFSLTLAEPLKGVDTSRITVLNVSGVVNVPNEIGSTIADHFDCRAYFRDRTLAHTVVLFDHGH